MGQNTGVLIAVNIGFLYLIMGPVVLFAIYVLFDHLAMADNQPRLSVHKLKGKDPALWTLGDIWKNF